MNRDPDLLRRHGVQPEVLVKDAHDLGDHRPRKVAAPIEKHILDRGVELDLEKDLVGPHRLRRHDERVPVLSGDVGLLESVIIVLG